MPEIQAKIPRNPFSTSMAQRKRYTFTRDHGLGLGAGWKLNRNPKCTLCDCIVKDFFPETREWNEVVFTVQLAKPRKRNYCRLTIPQPNTFGWPQVTQGLSPSHCFEYQVDQELKSYAPGTYYVTVEQKKRRKRS